MTTISLDLKKFVIAFLSSFLLIYNDSQVDTAFSKQSEEVIPEKMMIIFAGEEDGLQYDPSGICPAVGYGC